MNVGTNAHIKLAYRLRPVFQLHLQKYCEKISEMRHNVKCEIQMEINLQTEKINLTLQWFQHVHNQNADDPLLHRDMLLTVYSTAAQQFQWFFASKDPDETETIFKSLKKLVDIMKIMRALPVSDAKY